MQNSVQLLQGILETLGKIEANTSEARGGRRPSEKASDSFGGDNDKTSGLFGGLGFNMKGFFDGLKGFKGGQSFLNFTKKFAKIVSDIPEKDAQKMKIISESFDSISSALPNLVKGLRSLGKPKMILNTRLAIKSLRLLYEFMDEVGDGRKTRKIKRATDTFKEIASSLRDVAKPIKQISNSFITLGLGIVGFAGAIVVAGALLGLGGVNVIWGILGAIGGIAMMFGLLALLNKSGVLKEGMNTMEKMGLGMAALALGIISFSIAIAIVPAILGTSGNAVAGVLMVGGIILGSAGIFWLIGKMGTNVVNGVGVAVSMGVGMMALAGGVLVMALVARMLGGLGDKESKNKKGEERGKFGQVMAGIGPGLGVMGIVLVGAALFFAGMGVLAPFIIPAVGVSLGMAVSMILLSLSVWVLVNTAKKLEGEDIRENIGGMIESVLGGFLDGISILSDTGRTKKRGKNKGDPKKRIRGFIKNSVQLIVGVGILMSVSVALSMFARALTAFAKLGNMRVIEGYDEKTGNPKFGETVNISEVGNTVGTTISTFLTSLIDSTTGLEVKEARAIKEMGRALTGRRGILSAIIQFADVLKVFAKFGQEGKIGYAVPVLNEDGTIKLDDSGNPIMKQESVTITKVVEHIISSFGTFVSHLTSHTKDFELDGKEKRKMKNLGRALGGRGGLLEPISDFADTLQTYSKFGENLLIPLTDDEGKPTGGTISVQKVAGNILTTLVEFVNALGAKKLKQKTKTAEKNLKNYQNVIKLVSKTAKGLDDLSKLTDGTTKLAESIKLLSTNLGELDVTKLEGVVAAAGAYVAKTEGYNNIQQTTTAAPAQQPMPSLTNAGLSPTAPTPTRTTTAAKKQEMVDWDTVSQKIGMQVGAQIMTAMKSGQLKFVFSGGATEGILELD